MKVFLAFLAFLAFIIWMFVSLILTFSIVGLFFMLCTDGEWIKIGKELVSTFKSK